MIPEAAVAMLACARIGAPHSVVFGGFSAEALHSRIDDARRKVVITSDGGYRRGTPSALKPAVDAALDHGDTSVENVLVVKRTGQDTAWTSRDVWWHDALEKAAPPTRRRRTRPSTRSSSSTPPARRGSPRASSTRPAAT